MRNGRAVPLGRLEEGDERLQVGGPCGRVADRRADVADRRLPLQDENGTSATSSHRG